MRLLAGVSFAKVGGLGRILLADRFLFCYGHRRQLEGPLDHPHDRHVERFLVEVKRVGTKSGRLVHIDQVFGEGVHVVDGHVVLLHDLCGGLVVLDFRSHGKDAAGGRADRGRTGPDDPGPGSLGFQSFDQGLEVLGISVYGRIADAADVDGHHAE